MGDERTVDTAVTARRVVVVGSGVAGLAAALAVAEAGVQVTVVERADGLGGTSAISGGVAWLPGNHVGDVPDDDADRARRYLDRLALGDADRDLVEAFLADAPRVARWVEERTRLRWDLLDYPDYHQDADGAALAGRALEPAPLALPSAVTDLVRPSPHLRVPVTYGEGLRRDVRPEEVRRRAGAGMRTMGQALVGALVEALVAHGADLITGRRVDRLVTEPDGTVGGVSVGAQRLSGRVVLASGGFERDPALVRTFLRGPMDHPAGVGTLEGDGLRLAMAAGAALGNMSEAWWVPAMAVPGEEIDGAPLHRLLIGERANPHSLMVDQRGRRFTDEAQNYNDLGRELQSFDAATMSFPRVPCWIVVDRQFRSRYPLGPVQPEAPDPPWLITEPDLASLAGRIGVPADELVATVERFNAMAAQGRDDDFARGDSAYDRYVGDPRAPHPNLGTVADPPFHAVEVRPGCLGTKGGPRTDTGGRVLAADSGEPIGGLFAAGNVAASPLGFAYPGAGGTIGPALVFGVRAGETAAAEATA